MQAQFTPQDIARFWDKVDDSGGPDACWLWTAGRPYDRYGRFWLNGETIGAHRAAYLLTHGEIPDGLCVCHNCPDGDNMLCVNPAHLFAATNSDNLRDMWRKGRGSAWGGGKRGEESRSAKLTEADVREIRRRFTGVHGQVSKLAREYGVDPGSMTKVVYGATWRHVK